MQYACAILSSVVCLVLLYFFTLSHKRRDLRRKVIENKMCVLIFSTNLPETFPILRRNDRDIMVEVHSYIGTVTLVKF
jgi:hypothetical protein